MPLAAASVQARFDDVVAAAELARWAQQPEGGGDGERPAHGSDKEWTRNGGGRRALLLALAGRESSL